MPFDFDFLKIMLASRTLTLFFGIAIRVAKAMADGVMSPLEIADILAFALPAPWQARFSAKRLQRIATGLVDVITAIHEATHKPDAPKETGFKLPFKLAAPF